MIIDIFFLILGIAGSFFSLYWGAKTLQTRRAEGKQIQWYRLSSIILPAGLLIIIVTDFLREAVNPFAPHPLIDLLLIIPFLIGLLLLCYGIYLSLSHYGTRKS